MAVSTSYAPLSFNGNGATTAFAVTWQFFTGSLVVTLIDDEDVETVQSIGAQYTVSGGTDANGLPATGTVTMMTAPATGEALRIERVTPKTQSTTYAVNDAFPPKTIEGAFDRGMLIGQENAYAIANVDLADITLGVGTVTTGSPGTDAAASITGGPTDYLVNFTIPRGNAGATGAGTGDLLAANNLSDIGTAATAFANIKQAASTTATGVVELATDAEAAAGTDSERYITSAQLHEARADVASAATCNIGAAASNFVRITGTTTITAFDTVAAGIWRWVTFADALTLTHNGTSLIVPGAANITTAANDRMLARSLGSGNWIVLDYVKANGQPIAMSLASVSEAGLGTNTTKAVTPAGLYPGYAVVNSASTADIGAAASSLVQINGTTTITAFDTAAAGIWRWIIFADVLTLTHGAALALPSSVNITTAALDWCLAISSGSGNWDVAFYQRKSGRALVGGGAISDITGLQTALDAKVEFTTSSSESLTNYAVGSIVLVDISSTGNPNRNSSVTLYKHNTTLSLITTSSGGATALSGTWRAKGAVGDAYALFQRVA